MFPKIMLNVRSQSKQQGSALVIAIFIIVVMTLLGSALVRMIGSNAETVAYEVIGTRAYQAAQAGTQRKLSEIFPLLPGVGICTAVNDEYDFSAIEGLNNCKAVSVNCSEDTTVNDITYYTITSTGQCTVAGVFTSRKIEVKARSL